MKRQMLGVLLLIAQAAPLMAQQGAPSATAQAVPQSQTVDAGQVAPQAKTADAAKENEKVCKLMTVSGSRFKSRLCYTQHEWDAIDRAHKDKMREIDSQPIKQRSDGG